RRNGTTADAASAAPSSLRALTAARWVLRRPRQVLGVAAPGPRPLREFITNPCCSLALGRPAHSLSATTGEDGHEAELDVVRCDRSAAGLHGRGDRATGRPARTRARLPGPDRRAA